MPASARVKATDVAAAAGVSAATVSYVLNSTPGQTIPEATRARVLAAAESLGYVPNATATALARGSSDVVIIDFTEVPFGSLVGAMVATLSDAVQDAGLVPIVELGGRSLGDHANVITLARATRPRAVVTMAMLDAATAEELTSSGVPLLVSVMPASYDAERVIHDAAVTQVGHLAGLGHTRLAYAPAGTPGLEEVDAQRWRGIEDAVRARGLRVTRLAPATDVASAVEAVEAARRSGATAIAAYNDEVALAMLAGAHAARVAVPRDLSIMGIDDIPQAQFAVPALTSVRYSTTGLEQAVDLAAVLAATGVRHLASDAPTQRVIVRDTTAAPPTA
ncbi:LacI family DNA-binding transcriptional regulator [Demequina sp. SYSU T00192]|uniref:LacI family DNA-binding transcriptional regulator n=1 Tax=Demequina litoralis TaxID=3051660 RepID=A0ABT8GAF6_9MICO|nr:LacI family DNA-binding transcriptional regulator [Demequina sp. SYSU T00192]MDN4476123.1 LacI family DNA-binding transcriptional regulator [Demequina sp. SYSU T00192]